MSLIENLKKKIRIDGLSRRISVTVGPPGSKRKIDKESMRELLSMSPFVPAETRDLELYYRELEPGIGEIVCLDNELPLFGKTSLDDVALRRSPEIKEMVNIRKIIRILHDKDIRICHGADTVHYVHDRALELLDFSFDEKDVQEMVDEGLEALARADSEAVLETLELFVELLEYDPVPAAVLVNDYVMFGARQDGGNGREAFGPIVMYNDRTNVLRMIKRTLFMDDALTQAWLPGVASGEEEPDAEGLAVFQFLKEAALLKRDRPTIH